MCVCACVCVCVCDCVCDCVCVTVCACCPTREAEESMLACRLLMEQPLVVDDEVATRRQCVGGSAVGRRVSEVIIAHGDLTVGLVDGGRELIPVL